MEMLVFDASYPFRRLLGFGIFRLKAEATRGSFSNLTERSTKPLADARQQLKACSSRLAS
jgi:hypothetical protein